MRFAPFAVVTIIGVLHRFVNCHAYLPQWDVPRPADCTHWFIHARTSVNFISNEYYLWYFLNSGYISSTIILSCGSYSFTQFHALVMRRVCASDSSFVALIHATNISRYP